MNRRVVAVGLALFACVTAVSAVVVAVIVVMAVVGEAPDADPPSSDAEPAPADPAVTAAPPAVTSTPGPDVSDLGAAVSIATLVDPAWVADTAARTGIPPRALAAYAGAALETARTHPGCGIGWNMLAAIGSVESAHGTFGGGRIHDDGVARPQIIGVPLDGTSTARIPDTDGGALDGDPVWDRAVGPLQVIPSTWASSGRDGSGDGIADVHQIDDASLSAALYLCDAGGDLTTSPGWIAAVHAYNPDVAYNRRVAAAATGYAAAG